MSLESLLHWLYVAVMAGSALTFLLMSRNPKGVPQYKYLIHTFVVVWSGLAYAALAMNQGKLDAFGQTVYYARYIDWAVTTPLLLLSLVLTGKYTVDVKGPLTAALMGTQVIMILTGLLAELSPAGPRWFWYIAGCVALLIVLRLFWGPLYNIAQQQGQAIANVYRDSAVFLTVQWLLYPTVWLLGTPGVGLFGPLTTTALLILLPIVSKSGFAFYNLSKLRSLPPHLHNEAQATLTAQPAHN
ncbi:bacteriorhodopsin [Spirosoma montaniterrae]|nr:bacteriorhodopsin [Spirosoma montaniterrae]